jgi:hypothetical protein
MTQCILSHVLTNHHHQLNRNRLELFYKDCLNKDELLDEFETIRQTTNVHRRELRINHRNRNHSKNKNFVLFLLKLIFFFCRSFLS